MIHKAKNLPKEVIDHWPEIFEGVMMNVLPLQYVHSVLINFKDGTTWNIKVTNQIKNDGWNEFEQSLAELLKNYEASIEDIDFKLDVSRVKKDITRKTNKFLNKKTI